MFEYELSEEIQEIIGKVIKKNPILIRAVHRKIKEIISRDTISINIYKNLRYDMKEYKRVHITKSVVLIFKVNYSENKILFVTLKHHDNVYT